jgi:hypothetical protein
MEYFTIELSVDAKTGKVEVVQEAKWHDVPDEEVRRELEEERAVFFHAPKEQDDFLESLETPDTFD